MHTLQTVPGAEQTSPPTFILPPPNFYYTFFPTSFPTSSRRCLPFSFRALFEAELQFSELIFFWRIIVVLGGEGEVGRLQQVTPCEKGEKVQKKVRERERARSERWSLRLFGEDGQLTIQREAKIAIFRREIVLVCSLKSLQRLKVKRVFFCPFCLSTNL